MPNERIRKSKLDSLQKEVNLMKSNVELIQACRTRDKALNELSEQLELRDTGEYQDKMEKLLWIIEQDEAIKDFCNDLPDKFDKSEVEILDIHLMFNPKERYILRSEDTVTGTELYKETLGKYTKTKKINLTRDNVDNVLIAD